MRSVIVTAAAIPTVRKVIVRYTRSGQRLEVLQPPLPLDLRRQLVELPERRDEQQRERRRGRRRASTSAVGPSVSPSLSRGCRNSAAETRRTTRRRRRSASVPAAIDPSLVGRAVGGPVARPPDPRRSAATRSADLRPGVRPGGVVRARLPAVVAAFGQRRLPQLHLRQERVVPAVVAVVASAPEVRVQLVARRRVATASPRRTPPPGSARRAATCTASTSACSSGAGRGWTSSTCPPNR